MTPGARVQAAIDVIDGWLAATEGLDRVLAAWGRANRYAGSGDRRAIADLVYSAIRRQRSAAWIAGAETTPTGRDLLLGSLLLDGIDHADFFSGLGHAPDPVTEVEAVRIGRPLSEAPSAVRLDLPEWLAPQLSSVPEPALELMRQRAGLFLRVNTLRTDPAAAIASLASDGIIAEPGPLSPTCLAVLDGANAVARSTAFADGLVEIQDAASQAAADYADANPGETVLDYCAGAGGKTLAFAASMQGQGRLYAHDTAPKRLAQLSDRSIRAGALIDLLEPGKTAGLTGVCDLVFVDAPCSGSGAWRRNPDAKWRLTDAQLQRYVQIQAEILHQAAAMVRPGGRLVYATCSLVEAENAGQVSAFLTMHARFVPGRMALSLTPLDGGDGFFAAELLQNDE